MTTDKTFSSWERRFRSSELGGLALKSLQDLRRWDEQRFSFLELHVLEACHAAHVYQKSGDVHKQVRVKDAEISRDQSKLIRQAVGDANRLAQFLRKYEVQVQFPLAFCGHHFVDDDSAGATPLRIARVLEDMASYLDEGGAIAKSGNFMHRHSVGCLFCIFHAIPVIDSTAYRSLIPCDSGQRFHGIPVTDSTPIRSP